MANYRKGETGNPDASVENPRVDKSDGDVGQDGIMQKGVGGYGAQDESIHQPGRERVANTDDRPKAPSLREPSDNE